MFSILLLLLPFLCMAVSSHGFALETKEKDFNSPIEKLLLVNNHLFVGTTNALHRLSSSTLNPTLSSLSFVPSQGDYHWKVLLPIAQQSLLLCGTLFQGVCQLIDENLQLLINSSTPVVANDPINSTVALLDPEKNLIYFGVTYTNEGVHRWQIPSLAGRSLNFAAFMNIVSSNNGDESISRDDLSLRFMPRQQATHIVQYIYAFQTKNYVYFLTNQPNEFDPKSLMTKIVRFCRENSPSIIRSYTELPLICGNPEWILRSAQLIAEQKILIGHFTRKDGSGGTNVCSWQIVNQIDRAIEENYRTCYSMGIGQRGLAFIKPNEPCRKDESWSLPLNTDNLCPWIISERLPYPVGGTTPVIGRLLYENLLESTSALQMSSIGAKHDRLYLFIQGLINGTLKLGLFELGKTTIEWFHSTQLSSQEAILPEMVFDNRTATFFVASRSKITRLSFLADCSSRSSCEQCLSSSINPFCVWCPFTDRCTLANECPSKSTDECTQIVHVQPLNASVEDTQWINLTFSSLPTLEHQEIYQCIFADKTMSANTQAIKLDHNRLSCPTPSATMRGQTIVRLSVVKWPSNVTIATVPQFTFFNCSAHSSCLTCRSHPGCQWCSQRCSSMCPESISPCSSFELRNQSHVYLESEQSMTIPLQFTAVDLTSQPIECRLNETNVVLLDSEQICRFARLPSLERDENNQAVSLNVYQNHISLGRPLTLFIYRCDLYQSCDQCQSRSNCHWCQGRCSSTRQRSCSITEQCTSLRLEDFSPKILPLRGETLVTIRLNEHLHEKISDVSLADIPCRVINVTNVILCRAQSINAPRQGPISLRLANAVFLLSRDPIEYRSSNIQSISPKFVYEVGGQVLQLQGENLFIGNEQILLIGNVPCPSIRSTSINRYSCRLPPMVSGIYNVSFQQDQHVIATEEKLTVTPNPSIQDIDPTISFASGGRLVTVRGMHLTSTQSITVEFSYRKWNAKLKVNANDIVSTGNELMSSFHFRTPPIPAASADFPSPPFDVNLSLHFDDSLFSIVNLIEFHYIADVLLNISSIPPTLPYTGEELKLQVENLTDAASMPDIQLFIGCSPCQLKTFTSKGITCQPPTKLNTNTAIVLNQASHDDCSSYNASIGPIRFRIGYREYLIGYLSYTRAGSLSTRYSLLTIVSLIVSSSLLTIALLTLGVYLFLKFRKSDAKSTALANRNLREMNDKPLWSTDTSASTGPYYQVYEQISCSSSHENTLTRAPLLLCSSHYQERRRCTPPIMEQLQMNLSFLPTLAIDDDQLKDLLLSSPTPKCFSLNVRRSMEFFYDLLHMKPFAQAFLDQLLIKNNDELLQSYGYLFRFDCPTDMSSRETRWFRFVATLSLQNKADLIHQLHFFDDFLRILIDYLDSAPTDQLLHRSSHSICSSTLLLYPLQSRALQLTIDYEDFLRFHLPVLDCDTIDQIKEKLIRYLNSHEKTHRLLTCDQVDLQLPSITVSLSSQQMPMIKNYFLTSTLRCQKKAQWSKEKDEHEYLYHLCRTDQLIGDEDLIHDKLIENKKRLQPILIYFYQQIAHGLDLFANTQPSLTFPQYIQLVSDFIRRLNRLMLCRSTCPIVESCLNTIADGLEFIFDTKTEASSEVQWLFAEEKKHLASTNFHLPSSTRLPPNLSSPEIRSLILADQSAIDCLFKLYQFYELSSEPINQQIGENHVSVLLPVHHLLVQIRQLLKSDSTLI